MDNNLKKIIKLKNGIQVMIIPMNTILTNVSINMLLGSNHEKYNEIELTHYMEHLMARFTSEKHNDYKEISRELNKRGAITNAYVTEYDTCFYIKGFYKDAEYYIDILANMINNFYLEKSIMDQEKRAVVQELRKYTADPEYIFDFKIMKYMYGKYAYQNDIDKHIKKVKTYNSKDVYRFIENHVLPQNIIVSVTCPLTKVNNALKLVKKHFSFQNNKTDKQIKYPLYQYNNKRLKVLYIQNKYKKKNNASVRVVVDNSIKYLSKEHLSLLFLKEILFNFETGIFYKKLRDEKGLIYNINIDLNIDLVNPKSSSYMIETSVEQKDTALLIQSILEIISKISLTDKEIQNGRTKFMVKYEDTKFNDLTSFHEHYTKYLLHKIPIVERSKIRDKIMSVTNTDINKTFEKFKKDILTQGLIFYFSTKNQNDKIKSIVKRKIQYISIKT
jgi:predicted Zn-dependent peptidase